MYTRSIHYQHRMYTRELDFVAGANYWDIGLWNLEFSTRIVFTRADAMCGMPLFEVFVVSRCVWGWSSPCFCSLFVTQGSILCVSSGIGLTYVWQRVYWAAFVVGHSWWCCVAGVQKFNDVAILALAPCPAPLIDKLVVPKPPPRTLSPFVPASETWKGSLLHRHFWHVRWESHLDFPLPQPPKSPKSFVRTCEARKKVCVYLWVPKLCADESEGQKQL